jgi:hypothetical protein
MEQEKNKTTGPLPHFPPPSFLPSSLTSSSQIVFFLAKNIGDDGIQTCVSKFKPSLVQGLVLLGKVGRSDGQDIHLSHQLSHQCLLSVSLLLMSVLSICVLLPPCEQYLCFMYCEDCFVFFFVFFPATTHKFFTISILLQQQQQQNSQPNSSIAACGAKHSNSKLAAASELQGSHESEVEENFRNRQTQ